MKYLLTGLIATCSLFHALCQDVESINSSIQKLYHTQNKEILDQYWIDLTTKHSIPLVKDDSVAFLYRGDAKSVSWMGDFNGWGYDKAFKNEGKRIGDTDIWILKTSFPNDARLDYKIVVDGNNWMLDPLNPNQQWSGVGGGSPNSELRMPSWKEDPITIPVVTTPHGKLEKDILISSKTLGYQITYNVFCHSDILHQKHIRLFM